jgi:hypothetical protein
MNDTLSQPHHGNGFWKKHTDKVGVFGSVFAVLCCLGFPALLSILKRNRTRLPDQRRRSFSAPDCFSAGDTFRTLSRRGSSRLVAGVRYRFGERRERFHFHFRGIQQNSRNG